MSKASTKSDRSVCISRSSDPGIESSVGMARSCKVEDLGFEVRI